MHATVVVTGVFVLLFVCWAGSGVRSGRVGPVFSYRGSPDCRAVSVQRCMAVSAFDFGSRVTPYVSSLASFDWGALHIVPWYCRGHVHV
jgi:hypothetical protein